MTGLLSFKTAGSSVNGNGSTRVLNARWLGRVPFRESLSLQRALFEAGFVNGEPANWLLLQEHNPVYTLGIRTKREHLLSVESTNVDVVEVDRGGDVTYHGPGQLVGYPVLSLAGRGGVTDTQAYIARVEQLLIDVLSLDFGLAGCGRLRGYPGVWLDVDGPNPRKIAAVGVRLSRGRTMHGFALNVKPNMDDFANIVPCGISGYGVTSMALEGLDVEMRSVVDAVVARSAMLLGDDAQVVGQVDVKRQDIVWRTSAADLSAFSRGEGPGALVGQGQPTDAAVGTNGAKPPAKQPVRLLGRLAAAGVDSDNAIGMDERKPSWMRVRANFSSGYQQLKGTVKDAGLVTVCEEAGCPNIYECWNDGTATFMINGERCTRACGFCLVDTRKPEALDPTEPLRVAQTVLKMKLQHAVITTVARDDLSDGGANAFAETIRAVRAASPSCAVEVLISDCKGDPESLQTIFDARPDVLNHNIETVARLQRAVRPSAGYARSLSVLARAKAAGLVVKSGMMVGLGEDLNEVKATLVDLCGIGVDIVTIGQYLRPTSNHLPIQKWWTPEEFDELKVFGEAMGIAHVESSPLTRSSYHAKEAGSKALSVEITQKSFA